jgi:hypothetical protein
VFKEATLKVVNETEVRYGQGLQCADGKRTKSGCKPMNLLLDIISPASKMNTALRPAYIIMHGGGCTGYGETVVQAADPTNRSRYTNKAAPVIEFHGDKDPTVYRSQMRWLSRRPTSKRTAAAIWHTK